MFDVKSENEYGKAKNLFWWNDPTYIIGGVTSQERQVCIYVKTKGQNIQEKKKREKIFFFFLDSRYQFTVCEEDTIYGIQMRFYETFPEEPREFSIWRKDCLLVIGFEI